MEQLLWGFFGHMKLELDLFCAFFGCPLWPLLMEERGPPWGEGGRKRRDKPWRFVARTPLARKTCRQKTF